MAFDEVRLPIEVERGASGGPGFLTTVSLLRSGKEQRNSLWSRDRGKWDVGFGVQTRADALAVRDFFVARRGRLRGFRFRDWSNYQAETAMPTNEVADGSETAFQLWYRYSDTGSFYYEKEIYKPVGSTIRMFVDGAEIDSANFTVDEATGLVTFDSPPDYGADVTWLGTFDLPVRFDTDDLNAVITTKEVISFPSLPIVELKL